MRTAIQRLCLTLAVSLVLSVSAQARLISFDLEGKAGFGLQPGNENGTVNGDPGSGAEVGYGIVFNDHTGVLTINIAWGNRNGMQDLTGPAQAGHIHGPTASSGTAAFSENAGVLIGLDDKEGWNPDAANGGFSGSVTLTNEQVEYLFAGRLYINIHTEVNGSGEIRGNLVRQPFNSDDPIAAPIQAGLRVELEEVATRLVAPNLLISANDGTNRQYVVDQPGQIWIIENGTLLPTPFLDVSARLVVLNPAYDERGLLGLAFDPGFQDPQSPGYRRIFTYTSEPVSGTADLTDPYAATIDHHSVIASWRVDANNPNRIDPASREEILRIEQPQGNHNGGMLAFGPGGLLYIALGDGGGSNDNNPNGHNPTIGNGQDPDIALGKILRINVNGTNSANGKYGIPANNPFADGGGVEEIFALGFRNPYRFSFNGSELLVADVGQNNIEEIDRVELGKNYGWRRKEGSFKFNPLDGSISEDQSGLPPNLVDPIAEYDHTEGRTIIGGYVYGGNEMLALKGKYIFGDFSRGFDNPAGRLLYLDFADAVIRELTIGRETRELGIFVKGMGQDQSGEVYVLGSTALGPSGDTGVVYKLVPVPSQPVNISTRVRVENGESAMIGGFIVRGNEPKKVIVRAIGPSLTRRGVNDVVVDPIMKLHGPDGAVLDTNDDWKDDQQTAIENSGVPPTHEAESAIVATLEPGSYTAVVRGKNGGTGIGLVEVYDLDVEADSRLANISTRGLVLTEENVMIAGFIIGGGSGNAPVVVRGIGPSMSDDGVQNPIADPVLRLYDANGALMDSNDDWQDDPVQAQQISVVDLEPDEEVEAAMFAELPPGVYTAILAEKNGTAGVGLVEVFHLR